MQYYKIDAEWNDCFWRAQSDHRPSDLGRKPAARSLRRCRLRQAFLSPTTGEVSWRMSMRLYSSSSDFDLCGSAEGRFSNSATSTPSTSASRSTTSMLGLYTLRSNALIYVRSIPAWWASSSCDRPLARRKARRFCANASRISMNPRTAPCRVFHHGVFSTTLGEAGSVIGFGPTQRECPRKETMLWQRKSRLFSPQAATSQNCNRQPYAIPHFCWRAIGKWLGTSPCCCAVSSSVWRAKSRSIPEFRD